jgi:SAM-dependent methyltransferase
MNPEEYRRMAGLEDHYWWFEARRAAALRFLEGRLSPGGRVLDVGCGTGGLLRALEASVGVEATGIDASPHATACSRGRGSLVLRGRAEGLPFPSGTFDAVTALDVIEHLDDDLAGVGELARVLRPGGVLIATVPAYAFLWSHHDEALHHRRRYRARTFGRLIDRAGLRREKTTYLLCALFPVAAVHRLVGRLRRKDLAAGAALPSVAPWLNRFLVRFHAAEAALARRVSLPFGLTVLVVAEKPLGPGFGGGSADGDGKA